MTHDPLCFSDDDPHNCQCRLIALVRADERDQIFRYVRSEVERLEAEVEDDYS